MTAHELYQLIVGEIGISRTDFLFGIECWEAQRIVKGYRNRNRLQCELLRLCAYSSFFSMRGNKEGVTPSEWLTLPWEKDVKNESMPTDEEINQLRELIKKETEGK